MKFIILTALLIFAGTIYGQTHLGFETNQKDSSTAYVYIDKPVYGSTAFQKAVKELSYIRLKNDEDHVNFWGYINIIGTFIEPEQEENDALSRIIDAVNLWLVKHKY